MKKILLSFTLGVLLSSVVLTFSVSALAASGRLSIEVDPINIQVNGEVFKPTDVTGKEVQIFAYNGTTYAPLRALAEAYDLDVWYDSSANLAAVGAKGSAPSSAASPEPTNIPTPHMYDATGGQNSASISWEAVSGISGYEIHMATSTSGSYQLVKTIADPAANSAIISELDAGTTYYFKVRAYIDSNNNRYYGGFSTLSHTMTLADEGFSLEIKNNLPATIKNSQKGTVSFSDMQYGTSSTALGIKLELTFSGTLLVPGKTQSAPVGNAILYEKDSGTMVDSKFLFASYATESGDSFTTTATFHKLKDIAYVLEIVPK